MGACIDVSISEFKIKVTAVVDQLFFFPINNAGYSATLLRATGYGTYIRYWFDSRLKPIVFDA